MAEDIKYLYVRFEATLLRAPEDKTWNREIFRPDTGEWEEYTYSGAIEQWMHGFIVDPSEVGNLTESLKKLESSR